MERVVIRKFVSRQLSGNSFPPFHPPWGIRLSRNLFPPNCPPCHHSAGGLNHEWTQRRVCRIGDQKGDFGETENRTGRGQARDQQAIREQAQEGLFRKGAVVLCPRKQREGEAVEDGPRHRIRGDRPVRREIRRFQLQAFRREAERRRRDEGHVQERPQNPDLRRVQIAQTP